MLSLGRGGGAFLALWLLLPDLGWKVGGVPGTHPPSFIKVSKSSRVSAQSTGKNRIINSCLTHAVSSYW